MAALTEATKAVIWEDSGATLMARVVGNDAADLQQADVTGISYKIFDLDSATPGTATATGTCVVATVIKDTLQTDDRWTVDSTGYNFIEATAASLWPTGDHRYRIEYIFDPVSGEDFPVVFELSVRAIVTS